MDPNYKELLFNGRLNLITLSHINGTSYPSREWFVSSSMFMDNLNSKSINDARPGDLIIDSDKNCFEFVDFTGATGSGLFTIKEKPWTDMSIGMTAGSPLPYSAPQLGPTFIFRKTPNCELFQHGREALGIPEDIVEFLSQKTNYQIDGMIGRYPKTIIGSTGSVAPTDGQTGGIPNDREDPISGDHWIDPSTSYSYIYDGSIWKQGPNVKRGFDAYDSTGGQTISSTTPITINIDSTRKNTGHFSLTSNEVTFNTQDTFIIMFRVSVEVNSGSNISTGVTYLELDTGSGFNELPGTRSYLYHHQDSNKGTNTATSHLIYDAGIGDIIRIRYQKLVGTDTLETLANGSGITIHSIN